VLDRGAATWDSNPDHGASPRSGQQARAVQGTGRSRAKQGAPSVAHVGAAGRLHKRLRHARERRVAHVAPVAAPLLQRRVREAELARRRLRRKALRRQVGPQPLRGRACARAPGGRCGRAGAGRACGCAHRHAQHGPHRQAGHAGLPRSLAAGGARKDCEARPPHLAARRHRRPRSSRWARPQPPGGWPCGPAPAGSASAGRAAQWPGACKPTPEQAHGGQRPCMPLEAQRASRQPLLWPTGTLLGTRQRDYPSQTCCEKYNEGSLCLSDVPLA